MCRLVRVLISGETRKLIMPTPAQQTNIDYDGGPLPGDEPDYTLSTGGALVAIDPSQSRQDVADALQNVNQDEEPLDPHAVALSRGGRQHIATQEQFDALSPQQKSVIRAAASVGGSIKSSDALKVYQDSIKQARASQINTVTTSDGRKVDMVNGQIIPAAKQEEPVKMERVQADDGTIIMIDPTTGRSFPAWMENDGAAVRGQAKLSATQEDNIKRLQMQSENLGGRLNALTRFTEDEKVQYNDKTGDYEAAPWMGTKVSGLRDQLSKEKSDYDKRVEVSLRPVNRSSPAAQPSSTPAPAASPSPTPNVTRSAKPRPNPMPTPDKFIVDRTYTDANGNKAIYRGNGVFE